MVLEFFFFCSEDMSCTSAVCDNIIVCRRIKTLPLHIMSDKLMMDDVNQQLLCLYKTIRFMLTTIKNQIMTNFTFGPLQTVMDELPLPYLFLAIL